MADTNPLDLPVTQRNLEDMCTRIEKMVGEAISGVLQVISEKFKEVDKRLDLIEVRLDTIEKRLNHVEQRFDRIEDKLEDVAAIADHHSIDIRELKRKLA